MNPDETTSSAATAATTAGVEAIAGWLPGWIDLRRRMLRIPGVQVSVRVGERLLLSAALGTADRERDVPLTDRHLFRIASHSKTFAATACLILKERGELRLDDTVGRWVPELADSDLADVTVRALLGHQAGVIRDGTDSDFWQLIKDFPDAGALVEVLRADGRSFDPDLHFKYSNYGFSIIGMIVECVSGLPFNEFVRREILDVLRLPRLHPDVDGSTPGSWPSATHCGWTATTNSSPSRTRRRAPCRRPPASSPAPTISPPTPQPTSRVMHDCSVTAASG